MFASDNIKGCGKLAARKNRKCKILTQTLTSIPGGAITLDCFTAWPIQQEAQQWNR